MLVENHAEKRGKPRRRVAKEFGNAGTPVEDITGLHDCLTILALTRA